MASLKKKNNKGEVVKMVTMKETRCWRCDSTGHNQFTCSYPEKKLVCKICSPAHLKSRKHNKYKKSKRKEKVRAESSEGESEEEEGEEEGKSSSKRKEKKD